MFIARWAAIWKQYFLFSLLRNAKSKFSHWILLRLSKSTSFLKKRSLLGQVKLAVKSISNRQNGPHDCTVEIGISANKTSIRSVVDSKVIIFPVLPPHLIQQVYFCTLRISRKFRRLTLPLTPSLKIRWSKNLSQTIITLLLRKKKKYTPSLVKLN